MGYTLQQYNYLDLKENILHNKFVSDQAIALVTELVWIFAVCILFFLFYPITLEGRRGTTDEFATTPFHLDLFSAALVELAKSIPVHSLILSSHLFFCLPLFLFPFTVPCRIVFAKPEDLETWPNKGKGPFTKYREYRSALETGQAKSLRIHRLYTQEK